MIFWLLIVLLLIGGVWAARRLGSVVNPISLFSFGLAAPLAARLLIDSINVDWNNIVRLCVSSVASQQDYGIVMLTVLGGWLAFCAPWARLLYGKPAVIEGGAMPTLSSSFLERNTLPVFALLLICYASYSLGQLPLLEMVQGTLDVRVLDISLQNLPVGVMALIILATMVYALDVSDSLLSGRRLSGWEKAISVILFIFFSVWNGKRQMLLFVMFVFTANYLYRWDFFPSFRRNKPSPYILLGAVFVLLSSSFVLIDYLRYEKGWSRPLSALAYLSWPTSNQLSIAEAFGLGGYNAEKTAAFEKAKKAGNGFECILADKAVPFVLQPPANPVYKNNFLHSSLRAFRSLLFKETAKDKLTEAPIVPFVMTEMLPNRMGAKENAKIVAPVLHEPTSPSGFMTYWWLDGGLPFVMLGCFLFGALSLVFYRRRHMSPFAWQCYVMTLWAAATSGIYNHFITLIYFWLPIAFIGCRALLNRVRNA